MKLYLLLPIILVLSPISSFGYECRDDSRIEKITSQCQKSYYNFAPRCEFGDGLCLSLILQGLVNKNLFDYRPELRRVHNTPLKRRIFKRTAKYKSLYQEMVRDLKKAKSAEFCVEMDTYWLYDVDHNGFSFMKHTLIPKGKLFRISNVGHIGDYDFIPVPEREATEIESWENFNNTKLVFFTLLEGTGYVSIRLKSFIWFVPTLKYDFEGTVQIRYEEGCREPSYYQYKVDK